MSSLVKSVTKELVKNKIDLQNMSVRYVVADPQVHVPSLSHEEVEQLERKIGISIREYSADGEIYLGPDGKSLGKIEDTIKMQNDTPYVLSFASFYIGQAGSLGGFGADSFQLFPEDRPDKKGSFIFLSTKKGKQHDKIVKLLENMEVRA